MAYRVKIDNFEGPFQLLLSLVSEQKVAIGAVSVSEIADQYLSYVDTMHNLDMDVASDFLVVASTLLSIKASALLPNEIPLEFDEEFEDLTPSEAREILIARLIAYKQFKNVAASLGSRLETESRMHARSLGLEPQFMQLLPDFLESVTLHNLAVICAGLAVRRTTFLLDAEHVTSKPIPIEERIAAIHSLLRAQNKLSFSDLVGNDHSPVLFVANFLAILELYHRGMIDLDQAEDFSSIEISYRNEQDWAPAPVSNVEDDPITEYLETMNAKGELNE